MMNDEYLGMKNTTSPDETIAEYKARIENRASPFDGIGETIAEYKARVERRPMHVTHERITRLERMIELQQEQLDDLRKMLELMQARK